MAVRLSRPLSYRAYLPRFKNDPDNHYKDFFHLPDAVRYAAHEDPHGYVVGWNSKEIVYQNGVNS